MAALVVTWWCWVSLGWYWSVLGDTGSIQGGTDCYLVVLGQYKVVLVGTWWYWIKTRRYWLPVWYGFRKYLVYMVWTIKSLNTGSVEGGTGWYLVVLGQNRAVLVASMMSFQKIYDLHGVKHQIIEYSKKEKVMKDRQTDRQTEFTLVDSTPSVEGVE